MNGKRAIMLLTQPRRNEWNSSWGFNTSNRFALRQSGEEVKEFQTLEELFEALSPSSEIVVIWLNGTKYYLADEDEVDEEKGKEDLSSIVKKLTGFSILVATHGWPSLELEGVISSTFTSTDENLYENILLKLKTDLNFEKKFNEAWECLKKKPITPRISLLKHRIAHCFLSIDMDLQGISTTKKMEEAKEYLAGVLWGEEGESPKPPGYYVGKLEEARGLAGLEGNEPDTIRKIVQDQNLQNNEWWKCVKDLLGGDAASGKASSPIYPLFKSLDDLLDEGRNKSQNDQLALLDSRMQLLIEYFGNLQKCWDEQEEEHIWHFDDCLGKLVGEKDRYSFHDWFTALDEALNRLRAALPGNPSKRKFLHDLSGVLVRSATEDFENRFEEFKTNHSSLFGQVQGLSELLEDKVRTLRSKCVETMGAYPEKRGFCAYCEMYVEGKCTLREKTEQEIRRFMEGV